VGRRSHRAAQRLNGGRSSASAGAPLTKFILGELDHGEYFAQRRWQSERQRPASHVEEQRESLGRRVALEHEAEEEADQPVLLLIVV
jgi:hypothetical protein